MRTIKTMLLGSALAVALSAPAMAGDFHALAGLQGATPAPLNDEVLGATEGGLACFSGLSIAGFDVPTGVCLVSDLPNVHFAVSNELPVAFATFLSVQGALFPPPAP